MINFQIKKFEDTLLIVLEENQNGEITPLFCRFHLNFQKKSLIEVSPTGYCVKTGCHVNNYSSNLEAKLARVHIFCWSNPSKFIHISDKHTQVIDLDVSLNLSDSDNSNSISVDLYSAKCTEEMIRRIQVDFYSECYRLAHPIFDSLDSEEEESLEQSTSQIENKQTENVENEAEQIQGNGASSNKDYGVTNGKSRKRKLDHIRPPTSNPFNFDCFNSSFKRDDLEESDLDSTNENIIKFIITIFFIWIFSLIMSIIG